jgi:tRNA(Ile)-lysidine synthase
MSIFLKVESFLKFFCTSTSPLLLALSGGADSLCLFYCLITYRSRHGLPFHVAHVDHRWRQESRTEAQILQQLSDQHQVPFYLKNLNPAQLKGNLEAACRAERYAFFGEICQQTDFQGILTGHHQDDQAETIFKRMMEGSHWSRWIGLRSESWMGGMRILRPLLEITKSEIIQTMAENCLHPFEDSTNHNLHFLRARLRETIFPRLNEEFGKQVQKSFIEIGEEAHELVSFFEGRLLPLLDHLIKGPWGTFLDLQTHLPETLLEIKYLLRLLCAREGFYLSREIIHQAGKALQAGKAHQHFVMGLRHLWVDRRRIFIFNELPIENEHQPQKMSPGISFLGCWKLNISETVYSASHQMTSWKEGLQGYLRSYLPFGNYTIGFIKHLNHEAFSLSSVRKQWSQAKVPSFLSAHFPIVWSETGILHEFLIGKPLPGLREDLPCWKIDLTYHDT